MTHYEVLGVTRKAPPEVIDAAYKALAKIHHPDKGGNPAKFRKIAEAHKVLMDKYSRSVYDGCLAVENTVNAPRASRKRVATPVPEATIDRQPYEDPREAIAKAAKQYADNVIDEVVGNLFANLRAGGRR